MLAFESTGETSGSSILAETFEEERDEVVRYLPHTD